MLQIVRAGKVDEKNGVICLVFMFPSWVIAIKLSKRGASFAILCRPQHEI